MMQQYNTRSKNNSLAGVRISQIRSQPAKGGQKTYLSSAIQNANITLLPDSIKYYFTELYDDVYLAVRFVFFQRANEFARSH